MGSPGKTPPSPSLTKEGGFFSLSLPKRGLWRVQQGQKKTLVLPPPIHKSFTPLRFEKRCSMLF